MIMIRANPLGLNRLIFPLLPAEPSSPTVREIVAHGLFCFQRVLAKAAPDCYDVETHFMMSRLGTDGV